MAEARENNERTWNMMKEESFCAAKSEAPFTSIGTDHGIEQENRAVKVLGGIKDIANLSQNLDEHFCQHPKWVKSLQHSATDSTFQKIRRANGKTTFWINFLDQRTKEFKAKFVK